MRSGTDEAIEALAGIIEDKIDAVHGIGGLNRDRERAGMPEIGWFEVRPR